MRTLLSLLLSIFFLTQSQAQFELKTNPVPLIFEVISLQGEFCVQEDLGIQADVFAFSEGGYLYGTFKYYINPKYGSDRFHVGAFTGALFGFEGSGATNFGVGFMLGYKAVSTKRFVFDAGLGIGRGFSEDLSAIPYGVLSIGYRFPKKEKK